MTARDYIAEAESCSDYLDDSQRINLGIGQQLRRIADALTAKPLDDGLVVNGCGACWKCVPDYPFMRVCADCGNKRCPHASDHANDCTGSNATGQPGSAYRTVWA